MLLGLALSWYCRTHIKVNSNENSRINGLTALNELTSFPLSAVFDIGSHYADVATRFATDRVVSIYGEPWSGKTSFARKLAEPLIKEKGYIALCFSEGRLHIAPAEIEDRFSKSLFFQQSERQPRHVAFLCEEVHSLVTHNIFMGQSFVILFDDAFGHRAYLRDNALRRLRVFDWVEMARLGSSFGDIRVIVTSPASLVEEAKTAARAPAQVNEFLRRNLALLSESPNVTLRPADFPGHVLKAIITHNCKATDAMWARDETVLSLVVDEFVAKIQGSSFVFDAIVRFCQQSSRLDEEAVLSEAAAHGQRAQTFDEVIGGLSQEQQGFLGLCVIAQELVHARQVFLPRLPEGTTIAPGLSFEGLAEILDVSSTAEPSTAQFVSDWVIRDPATTITGFDLPVFRHPDLRLLAREWCRSKLGEFMVELVHRLINSETQALLRIEQFDAACRLSEFWGQETPERLMEKMMGTKQRTDPILLMVTLLMNWCDIDARHRSKMQQFIARLFESFREMQRYFLTEALRFWSLIDEPLRKYILDRVEIRRSFSRGQPPKRNALADECFGDHVALCVFANYLTRYYEVVEAAQKGCRASQWIIDAFNEFLECLARDSDTRLVMTSRPGDGLDLRKSVKYPAKDIVGALWRLVSGQGLVEINEPIFRRLEELNRSLNSPVL